MCQSGVFRSLRPRLSEIKIILQNESVSVELLFSVDFPLSSRSLSVPYAYQCCAFWGCDSYAHSNPEGKSLQDHSVAEDKGKCVRFYGMNPSFCYRDQFVKDQSKICEKKSLYCVPGISDVLSSCVQAGLNITYQREDCRRVQFFWLAESLNSTQFVLCVQVPQTQQVSPAVRKMKSTVK